MMYTTATTKCIDKISTFHAPYISSETDIVETEPKQYDGAYMHTN